MKPLISFSLLFVFSIIFHCRLSSQSFSPGWTGTDLLPDSLFLTPGNWITNVANAGLSDHMAVDVNGDTLRMNWVLGSGDRAKWAQCYLYFSQPRSFANFDLFAFNIKGVSVPGEVGFELKFEDGTHQVVVHWDKLAGLTRWAENISVSKKQFDNSSPLNWNNIRVISMAVYAPVIPANSNMQNGTVCITPLKSASMVNWPRATQQEFIDYTQYDTIRGNALAALINRQKSTGLLTTWNEDGTSWLYGQGLALKALSLEGSWISGVPSNPSAIAAEKLALFLANHQQPEGYWPRAWKTSTGAIQVLREADGTIWMGDFPWAITGLQAYFKKSGDARVKPSIVKGLDFLTGLIHPDGKFYTKNPHTGATFEVASCEAYAAAILSLEESGDTAHANSLLNYISAYGWDSQLRCWREASYSDRIVLFANTWMAYYNFRSGEIQKGLDALTLAGKVLYTRGIGDLNGMDGIVPLAVWYEGTLSYIACGGPGSIALFDALKTKIHQDGMVSHYNENLGGMGGIWAVDWHSLDGTSWLYFTAAGKSPFDVTKGTPVGININQETEKENKFRIYQATDGSLRIIPSYQGRTDNLLRIVSMDGRIILEKSFINSGEEIVVLPDQIGKRQQLVLVQVSTGAFHQTKVINLW